MVDALVFFFNYYRGCSDQLAHTQLISHALNIYLRVLYEVQVAIGC
jgi:hypothetical protein